MAILGIQDGESIQESFEVMSFPQAWRPEQDQVRTTDMWYGFQLLNFVPIWAALLSHKANDHRKALNTHRFSLLPLKSTRDVPREVKFCRKRPAPPMASRNACPLPAYFSAGTAVPLPVAATRYKGKRFTEQQRGLLLTLFPDGKVSRIKIRELVGVEPEFAAIWEEMLASGKTEEEAAVLGHVNRPNEFPLNVIQFFQSSEPSMIAFK